MYQCHIFIWLLLFPYVLFIFVVCLDSVRNCIWITNVQPMHFPVFDGFGHLRLRDTSGGIRMVRYDSLVSVLFQLFTPGMCVHDRLRPIAFVLQIFFEIVFCRLHLPLCVWRAIVCCWSQRRRLYLRLKSLSPSDWTHLCVRSMFTPADLFRRSKYRILCLWPDRLHSTDGVNLFVWRM